MRDAPPNSQPSPARRRSALRRAVRAKRNGTEEHDRPGRGRARAGAPGRPGGDAQSPMGVAGRRRRRVENAGKNQNQMCARRTRVARARDSRGGRRRSRRRIGCTVELSLRNQPLETANSALDSAPVSF